MAQQHINTGTNPSDGTGDGLRTALEKVNANFDEVYAELEGVPTSEDISAAVAAEATARGAAITTEVTARVAGDATNAAAITSEASTRAAADTTLASAITTETTARVAADATNAAAITSEASTRAAADTTLASAITTETTARVAADATNAAAITSEASTRAAADTANASAITAEASAREAAEALLAPLASPALTGAPTAPTAAPGTNTTQLANTAFVQAALAGAGSAISLPGVAWVQSSNGNDGTGVVGDPSHPFATAQAAYDHGATTFVILGTAGDINGLSTDINLFGFGSNVSSVGYINGVAGSVWGNGKENITVTGNIMIQAPSGMDGAPGIYGVAPSSNGGDASAAPPIFLSGFTCQGYVGLIAGNGGTGGAGWDFIFGEGPDTPRNGGMGGQAGTLTLQDCAVLAYAFTLPGNGGDGGGGSNCDDSSSGGGTGGDGGNAGGMGTINVVRSSVGSVYCPPASGGPGGAGGGGSYLGIGGYSGSNSSGVGTINTSDFSLITGSPIYGENASYTQTTVAGTWYP